MEDEDTVGWMRDDWQTPPPARVGPCKVIYVFDSRVATPDKPSGYPEDDQPFAGLPRGLHVEPIPPACLVGLAGPMVG